MSLLETARKKLDELEVTNTSKMYTPFTIFCIYFAIYFNADTLGEIFLSNNWEVVKGALEAIVDRTWKEWFSFVLKVVGYSLGMLVIYGVGQASAAFIWGIANWANTNLSVLSNRSIYVAKTELEQASKKIENLRTNEKKLYQQLSEYHTWKPEDIDRLETELEEMRDSYQASLEKLKKKDSELAEKQTQFDSVAEELKVNQTKERTLERVLKVTSNVQKFYKGLYKFEHEFSRHDWFKNRDYTVVKKVVEEYSLSEILISIENFNKYGEINALGVNEKYGLAIALLSSIKAIEYEVFNNSDSLEGDYFIVSVRINEPKVFSELLDSIELPPF